MTDAGQISAQGRRFQPFFVAVCIDARRRAGVSPERIADLAGVTSESVRRFEKGQTWPKENLEAFAAAYAAIDNQPVDLRILAELSDIIDGRKIFLRAMAWWILHGYEPLTTKDLARREAEGEQLTLPDLIQEIRRAGESERARDEAAERPTSTRKSRGASE